LQSKAMANCPTFPGLGLLRWRLKAEEATEKLYSEQLAFLEQAFERMPGLVEGRNLNPLPTKTPKPKKKAKRIGATAASNLSTATTATIGADDIYGPLSVEMLGVQASSKRRSRSPINGANAASNTTGAGARTTRTRAVAAASAAPARSTRTGRAAAAAASAAISTNSTSARGRPAAAGRVVAESSKKRLRSPVAASPFTRGIVGTAEAEKKKQRTAGAAPYRAPACMTPAATAVSLSRAAGRSAFCRAAAAAASSPKGAKKASISTPAVNREAAAGSSYMTEDVSCQLVDPNVSLMSVDDGCAAAAVGRTPVAGQCSGGAGAPQSSVGMAPPPPARRRVARRALGCRTMLGGGAAVSRASDDAAEERQRRRLLEEKERAEEERLRKRREKAEELRAQKARDKEEKRKRVLENAQKRQQEVQARSAQKLAQTELTGRVAQTLQAEAKRREETERKRRAEEEHRKAEEKRKAEEVQKKQEEQRRKNEEAERERKAAEEEERRKLAEKQEADRKRSAARKLAEEEAERKRAAEEAERKRLAAAEEAKKKAAEEAERNRKAKEEEAERQRKAAAEEAERRRKAAEEAVAAVQAEERESQLAWKKQSEALKVSQPFVPTTAYEKKLIPPPRSSPQTYPLDDLNSDAETDNEDAPRHALPRAVETLDLAATMKLVFPAAAEKAPRSSSAVWNTPPGANLRKIVNKVHRFNQTSDSRMDMIFVQAQASNGAKKCIGSCSRVHKDAAAERRAGHERQLTGCLLVAVFVDGVTASLPPTPSPPLLRGAVYRQLELRGVALCAPSQAGQAGQAGAEQDQQLSPEHAASQQVDEELHGVVTNRQALHDLVDSQVGYKQPDVGQLDQLGVRLVAWHAQVAAVNVDADKQQNGDGEHGANLVERHRQQGHSGGGRLALALTAAANLFLHDPASLDQHEGVEQQDGQRHHGEEDHFGGLRPAVVHPALQRGRVEYARIFRAAVLAGNCTSSRKAQSRMARAHRYTLDEERMRRLLQTRKLSTAPGTPMITHIGIKARLPPADNEPLDCGRYARNALFEKQKLMTRCSARCRSIQGWQLGITFRAGPSAPAYNVAEHVHLNVVGQRTGQRAGSCRGGRLVCRLPGQAWRQHQRGVALVAFWRQDGPARVQRRVASGRQLGQPLVLPVLFAQLPDHNAALGLVLEQLVLLRFRPVGWNLQSEGRLEVSPHIEAVVVVRPVGKRRRKLAGFRPQPGGHGGEVGVGHVLFYALPMLALHAERGRGLAKVGLPLDRPRREAGLRREVTPRRDELALLLGGPMRELRCHAPMPLLSSTAAQTIRMLRPAPGHFFKLLFGLIGNFCLPGGELESRQLPMLYPLVSMISGIVQVERSWSRARQQDGSLAVRADSRAAFAGADTSTTAVIVDGGCSSLTICSERLSSRCRKTLPPRQYTHSVPWLHVESSSVCIHVASSRTSDRGPRTVRRRLQCTASLAYCYDSRGSACSYANGNDEDTMRTRVMPMIKESHIRLRKLDDDLAIFGMPRMELHSQKSIALVLRPSMLLLDGTAKRNKMFNQLIPNQSRIRKFKQRFLALLAKQPLVLRFPLRATQRAILSQLRGSLRVDREQHCADDAELLVPQDSAAHSSFANPQSAPV
uniref:INCENP_ARK-bind domain-containing protein n=1 Tax=Macrostomum lignano TaxID=282301 RepID=A0A1I8FU15_9PLAT